MTSSTPSAKPAPGGKLIYCSCSETRAAGGGKSYYELIADPGMTPKVVAVINKDNHFDLPQGHFEFETERKTVEELHTELMKRELHELDGYNLEEDITGGAAYRIYLEYSSGEKVNIRWHGHGVPGKVLSAYNYLESFFSRWDTGLR